MSSFNHSDFLTPIHEQFCEQISDLIKDDPTALRVCDLLNRIIVANSPKSNDTSPKIVEGTVLECIGDWSKLYTKGKRYTVQYVYPQEGIQYELDDDTGRENHSWSHNILLEMFRVVE